MEQRLKTTPKDFFLHLGAMIALYVSVISFLALWFEYINVLFPDALQGYYGSFDGGIRVAMASLIVVLPLYIWLTRLVNEDLRKNSAKRELGVYKWLLYLTLFVAGLTVAIDLITLINRFLGGEITTRFVLKVIVVLIVSGGVFFYYLYALRGVWQKQEKRSKLIGWIIGVIALLSVIAGFFIIGSPQDQRLVRFDEEKVGALQNIQWQIVDYWQNKEALPETLEELNDPLRGFISPLDPQTGEAYEYNITGDMSFELCAVFNRESRASETRPRISEYFPVKGESSWEHGEGRTCFVRTIDPEVFPPRQR